MTVFADPTMEQSSAFLSVTGKPLSALKSGEGDMLGTAARALGTAGGDLHGKSIGSRWALMISALPTTMPLAARRLPSESIFLPNSI
ncbi:MAG: hypothetical protein IPH43_14365 [Xanthomonadales bacterium]|nr:hypothetical protein [Xanthomonadales bacterium]